MAAHSGSDAAQGDPLLSEFSSATDMRELITMFVDELPERIRALSMLTESGQLDRLCRLAHQLKGAGGGYGFPAIGAAAGRLEESLEASLAAHDAAPQLEAIRAQVDALIGLCRRVRAG